MSIEHYKKLFHYNFWANDRVWNCITRLSDEQFTRPCDYSIGSIHEQIVHHMTVEALWLERIQGKSPDRLGKTSDYPTREIIAGAWATIKSNWIAYLDSLNNDDLEESITFIGITSGKESTCLRWEGLSQVINHSTDHRAQILSLIHQVGGETIAQDFIYFVWDI